MAEDTAVIDGDATELDKDKPLPAEHQGGAIVTQDPTPTLAVTPTVQAGELVERMNVIREAADQAMEEDVDFGVIPGTNKPTLLKPGAEKLGVLFQLDIQIDNEKVWGPDDHLTVISKATAYFAPTGTRLGFGEGVCSTKEKKYAKRQQQRTCPDCGEAAVIKGKAEYGGGWLCFKKKGGCGHKWPDGAGVIEKQTTGEIDNPEIPDTWNTVVKMAEKRARVDAVLAVTGASALFTQDQDEQIAPPREDEPPAPAPEPIGEEEAKRLLALALNSGLTEGQILGWLKAKGYEGGKPADLLALLTPDLAARFKKAADDAAGAAP